MQFAIHSWFDYFNWRIQAKAQTNKQTSDFGSYIHYVLTTDLRLFGSDGSNFIVLQSEQWQQHSGAHGGVRLHWQKSKRVWQFMVIYSIK